MSQKLQVMTSGGGSLSTQQALFYRSLASMYNAGIHITRALRILADQAVHPLLRAALIDMSRRVEEGQRLSDAMAQNGIAFPLLHSHLVSLGENTGSLHLVLDKLAIQAEKATELRARLRAALTYPLAVFGVATALLIAAPAVVFKDLLRFLQELQVELPLATKMLVAASNLVSSPLIVLPLLVLPVGAFFLWHTVQSNRQLRRRVERILLTVPVVGDAVRAAAVCDFTRSLATCYATGIPILKSLELSANAADNLVFQDALLAARDRMRDGATLHDALQAADIFPLMTLQMVAVGEEAGRLPDMLGRVSVLAEADVEQTLEIATAALQPLMLLFIGIVVGFVVIATMAHMVKIVETL